MPRSAINEERNSVVDSNVRAAGRKQYGLCPYRVSIGGFSFISPGFARQTYGATWQSVRASDCVVSVAVYLAMVHLHRLGVSEEHHTP